MTTGTRALCATLVLVAACDRDTPIDPGPIQPALTLEIEDTVRFTRRDIRYSPVITLKDASGTAQDASTVRLRSENDAIVWTPEGRHLYAIRHGTTRIIAEYDATPPLIADTMVVIVELVPLGLVITPGFAHAGLLPGEELRPRVEVRDSTGLVEVSHPDFPAGDSIMDAIEWSTSDPGVVAASADGTLTGIAPGVAVVEARWSGFEATMMVPVSAEVELPVRDFAQASVLASIFWIAAGPEGDVYYMERHYRHLELAAVDPSGSARWRRGGLTGVGGLLAADDGTIHFLDAGIHALDPTGALLWRDHTCSSANSLTVGPGSALYCLERDRVVAIGHGGSVRWTYASSGSAGDFRFLIAAQDGTLYVVGSELIALTAEGTARWRVPIPGPTTGAIVDAEGAVYLTSLDARTIVAIEPHGAIRWTATAISGELVVGPDRTLVVAESHRPMITSLRMSDGSANWRTENLALRASDMRPHVGADGRLYVASTCHVHVFDLATGGILGRTRPLTCSYTSSAFVGNRLYLSEFDRIHEFTLPTVPGSEWSQRGGSARKANRAVSF